jgi:hypothetical protein
MTFQAAYPGDFTPDARLHVVLSGHPDCLLIAS